MKTEDRKLGPKPVRFDARLDAFLNETANATGISVSEVIRRSVRLMQRQKQLFHGYGFILDLV